MSASLYAQAHEQAPSTADIKLISMKSTFLLYHLSILFNFDYLAMLDTLILVKLMNTQEMCRLSM